MSGGFVDDESVCIIHVSSSLSPLAGHPSPLSGEGERSRYTQHDNQLYLCGQRTAVLHILQYYSTCVCVCTCMYAHHTGCRVAPENCPSVVENVFVLQEHVMAL